MKLLTYCLLLLIPSFVLAQEKTFELSGRVTGEHKKKLYLFYENQPELRDSTTIKDGTFRFRLKASLPILCRLHFEGNTDINELYIDSSKTFITLSSRVSQKDQPDSLGGQWSQFEITQVKGSGTEDIKRSFEAWKRELDKSLITGEQKRAEQFTKLQALVSAHPESKASAYLIAGRIYLIGQTFMLMGKAPFSFSEVSQLARLLDTSLHRTFEWDNLSRLLHRLDQERNRAVGIPFRDVVLKDTNNTEIDTKTVRNKYVLVDYWAPWCMPCRALNPKLKVLYEKYKDKGFEIVGISLDGDKGAWKKAIRKDGLPWIQLIDEHAFKGVLAKHYDITGVPTKTLLDREGKVVGYDLSIEEIEKILSKEL